MRSDPLRHATKETRMKRRLLLWCALLLLAVAGAACNPAIRVPYQRPAKVNLRGVNQIAIGGVYGYGGDFIYPELGQAIMATNRFQLVDRQYTEKLLAEISFQNSGFVDDKSAAEVGKLFGASALIFVNIKRYEFNSRVEKFNTYNDDKGVAHTVWRRYGTGVIDAGFQVIDCATGRVLSLENLVGQHEWYADATDQYPGEFNPEDFLTKARTDVIGQFVRVIAPYEDYAMIRFAKDKNVPQFEQGVRAIKIGDWAGAVRFFEEAYAQNPASDKAMYNLGVAYEYTWQFDRALPLLQKAYQTEPRGQYQREVANCQRLAAERAALEAQTGPK
jgi:tetratricopeptide (TPR) repeat protein